jgi:DNA-directed RNA polymerase subunit RPC12/RpoP
MCIKCGEKIDGIGKNDSYLCTECYDREEGSE